MDIDQLQPRTGKVNLTAEVVKISDIRSVNTASGQARVATATIKDKTGTVMLSLWNEQIDQVSVGDQVKIENGWVSEYGGKMQLSTGKFGSLEVLEKQKGLPGVVAEEATKHATEDELEEAEALSGYKNGQDPEEAVTPDNLEETPEVEEEDVEIEEEDVL